MPAHPAPFSSYRPRQNGCTSHLASRSNLPELVSEYRCAAETTAILAPAECPARQHRRNATAF